MDGIIKLYCIMVICAHQKGKKIYILTYDPRELIKFVKILSKNVSKMHKDHGVLIYNEY
jgi:hypothetical protein